MRKRDRLSAAVAAGLLGSGLGAWCRGAPAAGPHVVLDGSLGRAGPILPVNNDYAVTPDLGRQVGSNLFQSFTRLDAAAGEGITFSGPASVHNVLARVTGGTATGINGPLRCTIPGADFYLVNPAGVVFGPRASLDVKGSFAVTTADVIRLAGGGRFSATPGVSDAALTTAAPAAFGFLAAKPLGVVVVGQTGSVPVLKAAAGKDLSIVAGPVTLSSAALDAPTGQINLVAVASPGDVAPASGGQGPSLAPGQTGGTVAVANSFINLSALRPLTGPLPGGGLAVRGGDLLLGDSQIAVKTTDAYRAARGPGAAAGADIDISGAFNMAGGNFFAATSDDSPGGSIRLRAGSVSVAGDSAALPLLGTIALASGKGGDVDVSAGSVSVTNALVTAATLGAGDGGNLRVSAPAVLLDAPGVPAGSAGLAVGSKGAAGGGKGGDLSVDARNLTVDHGALITSNTTGARDSGNISIRTGILRAQNGGRIEDSTAGAGNAGTIEVTAPGGVALLSGAIISDITKGTGRSGAVTLRGGDVLLDRAGSAGTTGISVTSTGGATDDATAFTTVVAGGKAGDVTIDARSLSLLGGAVIVADTETTGAGGNVRVHTTTGVRLVGAYFDPADPTHAFVDSTIRANTLGAGAGRGGSVSVQTASLELLDGGGISASTRNTAPGGAVDLEASRSIVLRGVATPPGLPAAQPVEASIVAAVSFGDHLPPVSAGTAPPTAGAGGAVTIRTPLLRVDQGANVVSTTFGTGDAGSIDVAARRVVLSGRSPISVSGLGSETGPNALDTTAQPVPGAGDAGTVTVATGPGGLLRIERGAGISTSSTSDGNGGRIVVSAGTVRINSRGFRDGSVGAAQDFNTGLVARSNNPAGGAAGDIDLRAGSVRLDDGSEITVSSTPKDQIGGGIRVRAGDLGLYSSKIDARSQGAGGNVELTLRGQAYLRDSLVTAQAQGDGGRILIDPPAVVLDHSTINGLSGGKPVVVRIASPDLLMSNSRILTDTPQTFPEVDIAGSLVSLRAALAATGARLEPQCGLRLGGTDVSSFVVTGRGGLAAEPGGWEPDWEMSLNPAAGANGR